MLFIPATRLFSDSSPKCWRSVNARCTVYFNVSVSQGFDKY
jgi:hypothetical protein